MRLVTFQRLDGTWEAGEYRDGGYYTLGTTTVLDIIRKGGSVDRRDQFRLRSEPLLRAPLIPGKILCVGRNYAEHAAELGNKVPDKPLIFAKFGTSVITSGEHIVWRAAITSQVDWEGELGVVIGKRIKDITPEEADDAIFGYVVANDVSARDLQDADKQWARAKGMDTFCPIGPYLVTKDEIEDAHNLTIETRVNDEVMQRGYTGDMFFRIPIIISYLSQAFTLEPGDLILTGTPAGVGKGMTPPRFLQDGDVVTVTIEGLGSVRNTCRVID